MLRMLAICGVMTIASSASAQQAITSNSAGTTSMKELLSQGYEIKASAPNGTKFIVFLQKDKSAYACEFASLTNSRCGSIN